MINLQQQTPEWLEFRKTRIGASDASVILGINPWKSAYKLWQEKLGLIDPEPPNERMQRGIELEPKARLCFEEMTGHKVQPAVLIHPDYDWMMASMDGLSELGMIAVEIKCNGVKTHQEAIEGKIPDYYYCQLQHQMEVAGMNKIHYFSFDGENGVIIEVERDNQYIKDLIEKEKEFFQWMETFCPPPQPYIEMNDPEWIATVSKWKETSNQRKWLEEQEEILKKKLIEMANDKNCEGGGIRLCKEIRKGQVDYKSIPELASVDLEKYRKKPIECWKITQNKEK